MEPIASQKLIDDVYIPKGASYVNFYIVKRGDSLIAFDSGEDARTIKNEMDKLNLDPLKVTAVFLSHTDGDHVGGLALFSKAKMYISSEEVQMVNGKTARFLLMIKNQIPAGYNVLQDNQDIEVSGLKVHSVLTPGHTPGSMSYVVNNTYLFTGDTLSLKNGMVNLFNAFFNMDTNQQKISITKIANITGIKYIFTTHYGYSANYQYSFTSWNGN